MGAKGAYLIPLFLLALVVQTTALFGGDVKVRGYTRKDGTYVAPHTRSRPNALKWDNKSYTPSQPTRQKRNIAQSGVSRAKRAFKTTTHTMTPLQQMHLSIGAATP